MAESNGFPADGAFNVFVPGLLVQMALFGTGFVGFGLVAELRMGVIERMQVTPLSRLAMLLGRCLRDVLALGCQLLILVGLAIPFGLDLQPAGLLGALALVLMIGVAFSSLSYNLALIVRDEAGLQPLLYGASFPLLLLSGVLLPLSLAPAWLQHLAEVNPLSHGVLASRALFNGHFDDPQIVIGAGLVAALALANVVLAARRFQRSVA